MKIKLVIGILVCFMIGGIAFAGSITKKGITFTWKVKSNYLYVTLSAPTKGWVAVGFNPSKKMKGANIIIGYVKGGKAIVIDHFANRKFGHKPDTKLGGKNNVSQVSGWQKGKHTTLKFRIPLNSGDKFDSVLVKDKKTLVLLAYGKKDSFKSYHKKRAKVHVKL